MDVTEYTLKHIVLSSWIWDQPQEGKTPATNSPAKKRFDLFWPLRQWINNIEVHDPELGHRLCKLIPAQCPFQRQIKLFGRTLISIPPLCKLNPLYDELMALRFRAICYLADECGEDISDYC
ncbi:MAG: Mo-dependent nitrogenase C-terminal domain-containing protein [Xenococcaceae cyanobacterium]